MSDEQAKCDPETLSQLQREILQSRKLSLADAIGRMAGPGMMKGTSPIPRMEQAGVEIENYLRVHLVDTDGALGVVLLRSVKASEILLRNYEQPLEALARYVQRFLDSDTLMRALVNESDVEWGRIQGERPYFDREGTAPHPSDPYTMESVRATLSSLMAGLAARPAE